MASAGTPKPIPSPEARGSSVVGLFDSGLGGLTVVRRLRERLPNADIVFFADQAHVPYGDRTPEDLRELLHVNLAWLDAQEVDAIVAACNTSCAVADVYGWPTTSAEVFDLLDSAAAAVGASNARRIGVVGTAATVKTGAYGRRIRHRIAGADVHEVAAPALVPLVESGDYEGKHARAEVAAVCAQLPKDIDVLVLGCTHYPVLEAHFAAILGTGVHLIDPAVMQAERAATLIESRDRVGRGTTRYVTNGDLAAFHKNVAHIMGDPSPATSALAVK